MTEQQLLSDPEIQRGIEKVEKAIKVVIRKEQAGQLQKAFILRLISKNIPVSYARGIHFDNADQIERAERMAEVAFKEAKHLDQSSI